MRINEVAKLTGITVRTLHHYDKIKLLSPKKDCGNSYRYYSDEDIDRLQQILFFRACGFSLEKIKIILDDPNFNRLIAFDLQKKYLEAEIIKINKMIDNIKKSVSNIERGAEMSNTEKFEGFDFTKNQYEKEAKELYGEKVIEDSKIFIENKGKKWQEIMGKEFEEIFISFSKFVGSDEKSQESQEMVEKLYNFLNNNFGYTYSLESFLGLTSGYYDDKRFKKNIDRYGEGTAEFIKKSAEIFVENKKS